MASTPWRNGSSVCVRVGGGGGGGGVRTSNECLFLGGGQVLRSVLTLFIVSRHHEEMGCSCSSLYMPIIATIYSSMYTGM